MSRASAQIWGRWAETAACWRLRLKGFRILERGFKTGRGTGAGEVDIIARRGGLLAFVEVKARTDLDAAVHALRPRQQKRIAAAAQAFLAKRPHLQNCAIRFDVVLIMPGRWPCHISDAWRMDA